jgi:hypothetical protein
MGCDLLSFFDLLIFATADYTRRKQGCCCDLLSFFDLLIFATAMV